MQLTLLSQNTKPSIRQPVRSRLALSLVFQPDKLAATALYNPFPTFPFTGSLRPIYPLSPRRPVPDSIPHPNYAQDGDPKYKFTDRNKIKVLSKEEQEGMRKVCRLSREVLDIAAREVKPGVTTDYIDEVVHKACIERNVSPHYPATYIMAVSQSIHRPTPPA